MFLEKIRKTGMAIGLTLSSSMASAAIYDFHFTGQLTVADPAGNIVINDGMTATPISATLSYDSVSGIGSSNLSIDILGPGFLGVPARFHDITMTRIAGTNLLNGNVFVDWNGNSNMPLNVQWDATGLFNAIDYGLQVGDVISGTMLKRAGQADVDVFSATPYADFLPGQTVIQNFAPLAATGNSLGLTEGPFVGILGYFDIGSGNSLTLTSVSAVPVPAAVWLFGSGLLAFAGVARRKA